jgi:MFS family permease
MSSGVFVAPLALLRRARSFRYLFVATLESGLGTWLAVVALTVDVFDRTHSGKWVSALLIASFVPSVGVGLGFGPLLDRLSRRGVMIAADLVRAGVFCALPFTGSAAAIVALAGVAGVATGFFTPAVYAGLPNLVDDADLSRANSLFRSMDYLASAVGPLFGGILVAAAGPHPAYWINAVSFLCSALLIARIPHRLLQSERAVSRGYWRDVADGFLLVMRSRPLLTVLLAWSVAVVGNGGVNVAEVVLAKETFNAGTFGFGLLSTGSGIGLVLGSFAASIGLARRPLCVVYAASLALMAFGIGAAAASPDVWVAAACVIVSGFGNGTAVVCNALLVQRGAPDVLRGRAFTLIMSTNFAVLAVAMVAAGPLTDALGARWVWAGAAALAGVASAIGFAMTRGLPRETVPEAVPEPTLPPVPEPDPVATPAERPV